MTPDETRTNGRTMMTTTMTYRDLIDVQIEAELQRQRHQWGAEHDAQHSPLEWARLICEYAIKAAEEDQAGPWDETQGHREIVKVAALAIAWMMARPTSTALLPSKADADAIV